MAVALPVFIGGCDTVTKTYNDWFGAPTPAVKPAELVNIRPTATPRVLWQSTIGAAEKNVFFPAVVGNTVYVTGATGQIAGFTANTGGAGTRFDAGQRLSSGVGASATLIAVGTSRGELLAFDPGGKQVWKAQVPGELLAPPVVEGNLVVARSGDGRVFAYDAASGKRLWVYQRSTPALSVRNHAGVLLTRGTVFAGFPGGRLVALNAANGAVGWDSVVALPRGTTELERVADITSLPVADERQICAVAYQGRIACFDRVRGTTLWARDVSSFSGMGTDNRNIYVTDDKNAVSALSRDTGASVWRQDRLAGRGVSRPLALGRYVIVGDFQGYVHLLLRDDGSFAARLPTDGSAIGAAPVALDLNSFLVQTRNGGVYAITVQ
jgi:outer membrane protein assembly factor BamB